MWHPGGNLIVSHLYRTTLGILRLQHVMSIAAFQQSPADNIM